MWSETASRHATVTAMALFPDTALDPVHDRRYQVNSFRLPDGNLLVRGSIVDTKPPGLYVPGDDQPLEMHHMVVEFAIDVSTMTITDVDVEFLTHPTAACPAIVEHYNKLVGLSVQRGFNRRIRELFGGPRGCTHTTALLQAMAPVVVQSMWSLALLNHRQPGDHETTTDSPALSSEDAREQAMARNLNSCHIWDEHGTRVELMRNGEPGAMETPIPIRKRLAELDVVDDDWWSSESR